VNRYRIEPLQASQALQGFDCSDEALNRFLIRFALANQRARASRTYVALEAKGVVGFHTLVVGEVSPEKAPERIRKGLAQHPIPLMVLARLAVAVEHQGQGLGTALLKDAIGRTLAAADIVGIRALAVHAKDGRAQGFYAHFGFRPSPSDPLHLYVLMVDTPGPTANRHPLAFGMEASSNLGAAHQLLATSSRAVRLAPG
jgi:GNAT superfamily N-acetyltransferase